ncbi:MAG: HEAT repeat domain-containing protein [Opitutus sp.]
MKLPCCALIGVLLASMGEGRLAGVSANLSNPGSEGAAAIRDENVDRQLTVATGLVVTRWAAEPQLGDPVAIAFDARGRLYVAETQPNPASELGEEGDANVRDRKIATSAIDESPDKSAPARPQQRAELPREAPRVRVLEDRDGDGFADSSHLFANGNHDPLDGAEGGVRADPPELWLALHSTVGEWTLAPDSSARSEPALAVNGRGRQGRASPQGAKSIIRGPDGWLYFAVDDRGWRVPEIGQATFDLRESGGVVRMDPINHRVEVVAMGMRSPQDLAFDEDGNLFVVDDARGGGDRARLMQVVEGSDGGWRRAYADVLDNGSNLWLSEELWKPGAERRLAFALPPVCNVEDGVRGLTFNPDSALNADYRGAFFVARSTDRKNASGVTAIVLTPRGAGFELARSQGVLSGVLATDLTFGPDNRLYVADAGSHFPRQKPGLARIYTVGTERVSAQESDLITETRRLMEGGFAGKTIEELGAWLGHADQRIRLAAQFELATRGPAALPSVQRLAEERARPRLARMHALWAAGQMAERVPSALNFVPALLRDDDPHIRAQAARVLGNAGRFESFQAMVRALADAEPRVTFFAAQGLGKFHRPDAIPALLELLRRNDDRDPVVRQGVVTALARLGADPALDGSMHDPSRAVRRGGVLAYRKLGDARIAEFLQDSDANIVREAAHGIGGLRIESAMPALAALLEQAPLDDRLLVMSAIRAHGFLGRPENAEALGRFAMLSYVPETFRAAALNELAAWGSLKPTNPSAGDGGPPASTREIEPARRALRDVLGQKSGQVPEEVQIATIRAVSSLRIAGTGHALWDVVYQKAHPVRARVAALQALDHLLDARLEVAVQHAIQSKEPLLVHAALPILARLPAPVALPMLKKLAEQGSAAAQAAVYPIIAATADPRADGLLAQALERLRAGSVPLAARVDLISAVEARQNGELTKTLNDIEAHWRASGDRLAPYRGALDGGDPIKGRRIFERSANLDCVGCHEEGPRPRSTVHDWIETDTLELRERLLTMLVLPRNESAGTAGECQLAGGVPDHLSAIELRDLVSFLVVATVARDRE